MAEYIEGAEMHEVSLGLSETELDDGNDAEDNQSTVTRLLEEAVSFYEENIEPDQVKATEYFYARPFGNEKKGRSQVISTDVRDATLTQIPSIMEILFSPERTVEFVAHGEEDEPLAEQQTDYVNHLVSEQEESFESLHSLIEDALVRGIGIAKWWFEDAPKVIGQQFTGITEEDVLTLMDSEGVEVEVDAVYDSTEAPGTRLYDVHVERTENDGRAMWAAVPNEEFVFTPNARNLGDAQVIAHTREVPIGYLISRGFDEDEVRAARGRKRARGSTGLDIARQFANRGTTGEEYNDQEENRDDLQVPVLYTEAYVRMGREGDGAPEIRKFDCVGPGYKIISREGDEDKDGELVDTAPFAVFRAIPVAHNIIGLGNYDLLGDIQLIHSQIERGTLDSLAVAINPVTEIVQGEVNMQDAMNTDVTKFVRVRRPGMMREVKHTFVGADTLPLLGYFSEKKENRTGTSKASMGLDADALQSTTKAGVAATMSGSQQRLKFITRALCETGMRRLYKGLLKLTVAHQQPGRVVRLRGKYVPIDPQVWDVTMDVRVNIGLGQGTPEDRIVAVGAILDKLEGWMQAGVPFVDFTSIRKAGAKAIEMAGFRADDFLKPWGAQEEQQMQQQRQQQPPPPDPAMALVEIEKLKVQMSQIEGQAKLELERMKLLMEDDRARDKQAADQVLKEREIEAKYAVDLRDVELRAQVDHARAAMDADVKRETAVPPTGETT